jgi:hypothetical protein
MEEDEIVLAELKENKLDLLDGEIRYDLSLPQSGIWDITWSASLKIDGFSRETPASSEARVDLRTGAQRALAGQKSAMEALARRICSRLRNQKGTGGRQQAEESYSSLHSAIAKGRDLSTKLLKILRSVGESSSPALKALLDALKESTKLKLRLGKSLDCYGKKDTKRAFKQFLADKLERGDAEAWISSVGVDDLTNLGGDANRLYQLLIEGKKAASLAFNDSTIAAAGARNDIFTPKQCDILMKIKREVEAVLAAELQEAQKKEAEEMERHRMEAKARQMQIPRSNMVKIYGLKARSDLNGASGKYMGLAHDDRYTVRLHADGKDIALKACNFSHWDNARDGMPLGESSKMSVKRKPSQAPTWACLACTFVHKGHLASIMECSICGTAKGKSPKPTNTEQTMTETKDPASKAKTRATDNITQPGAEKKANTLPAKSVKRQESSFKPQQLPAKSVERQEPSSKPQHGPQNHTKSAHQQHGHSKSQPELQSQTSSALRPPGLHNVTTTRGGGSCGLGLFCPDLRKDPDSCRFDHSPEEVAVYHPEHPRAIAVSVLDDDPPQPKDPPPEPNKPIPSDSNLQQQKQDSNINIQVPPPLKKKAPKHCRYGLKCTDLKKGTTKCKFYHSPEEIAASHSNEVDLDVSKVASDVSQRCRKHCKFGLDCSKLRNGPTTCPFYHPMREIAVYHPNADGFADAVSSANFASNANVDVTSTYSSTKYYSAESSEQESVVVRRDVLIEASTAPYVVGKGGKHIKSMEKTSGAKIKVNRKVDANGMCTVHISGTDEAVLRAIGLVTKAASGPNKSTSAEASSGSINNRVESVFAAPEEVSILSESTGDEQVLSKQALITPTSNGWGADGVLAFLEKHKSCLKCSPVIFHKWLQSEDIASLNDLAEACADKSYPSFMQANGLKGFKRGLFLKAVKVAAASV